MARTEDLPGTKLLKIILLWIAALVVLWLIWKYAPDVYMQALRQADNFFVWTIIGLPAATPLIVAYFVTKRIVNPKPRHRM